MNRLAPLKQLTLNRLRMMSREPEVLFWVFGFPILLTVGIGIAFGTPREAPVAIGVDAGVPPTLVAALEASPDVEVSRMVGDGGSEALRRGEVFAVVSPSADGTSITLRFDPTRPEARAARLVAEAVLQEAAGGTRPLFVVEQPVESRGQRYIDWLIPGLVGLNLMSTGLWSVAFYTTQARENRELRRLVATPMRKSDFLLAQVFARYAFLVVEIPAIVLFAWLTFGVQVEGSLLALAGVVLLGATCFTAFGMTAGARARTTEGVSGIINLIMMPMLVLSGVFFSGERFPDAVQPLIQALPLTALNDALRVIYNDGGSLFATIPELAILAAWTTVAGALALRLFRWH